MDNRFIMTAFGKDRAGIVADVTKILFENGCNLEETTMTQLADEFTLILLFSCQQDEIEAVLERECRRLEREKDISAFTRPLKKRQDLTPRPVSSCVVHVEGVDQAGIVYNVSQFLADNGLNIVDLKSTVTAAPSSGTALYVMDIHVTAPSGAKLDEIEAKLSDVADELNVDISLSC